MASVACDLRASYPNESVGVDKIEDAKASRLGKAQRVSINLPHLIEIEALENRRFW